MNPFLPDEIEALRALVRTWPNAKMVVLGAAALRCSMPMSWRTTEDLDLTVAASIEDATAALSCFRDGLRIPARSNAGAPQYALDGGDPQDDSHATAFFPSFLASATNRPAPDLPAPRSREGGRALPPKHRRSLATVFRMLAESLEA